MKKLCNADDCDLSQKSSSTTMLLQRNISLRQYFGSQDNIENGVLTLALLKLHRSTYPYVVTSSIKLLYASF